MEIRKLQGLIAAPLTPMREDGSLNPAVIEKQARLFKAHDITGVFVCGTTGESLSLTLEEREQVAEHWRRCSGDRLPVIVHVGCECLKDAKELARHAQDIGADAVGSIAPTFFKPTDLATLVEFCREVAFAASELPFYYYHIPALTGLSYPMYDFLQTAEKKIPNLAGIKYSSEDLYDYGRCLFFGDKKYDILFGCDEMLLGALAIGARGAVGSFYNFLAPIFRKIITAYEQGDLVRAQELQELVRRFTSIYDQYGGSINAAKAVMKMTGIDCGPVRLPLRTLDKSAFDDMREEIENTGIDRYFMKTIDL